MQNKADGAQSTTVTPTTCISADDSSTYSGLDSSNIHRTWAALAASFAASFMATALGAVLDVRTACCQRASSQKSDACLFCKVSLMMNYHNHNINVLRLRVWQFSSRCAVAGSVDMHRQGVIRRAASDSTCCLLQAWGHAPHVAIGGKTAGQLGWRLGINGGYVGQGMIMGPRVCFSMLAGSIIGFGMLAPLALARGWADSPASGDNSAVSWVSWVSLSIMITDSLTSLAVLVLRYAVVAAQAARTGVKRRSYAAVSITDNDLHQASAAYEPTLAPTAGLQPCTCMLAASVACTDLCHTVRLLSARQ